MKISLGLGWLFSPLRYRRYRRLAAGGVFVMGAFSFITFDLTPRDGHLTAWVEQHDGPIFATMHFDNLTTHPIRDLHAGFAFFDFYGEQLAKDEFAPRGMTIEGERGKQASFGSDIFDPDKTAYAFFCGAFKGSYFFDRVRETWVVGRSEFSRGDRFGQVHYKKDRFWVRRPDCNPPESLVAHAEANGWDFARAFERYERAGMIPKPEQ